MNTSRDYMAFHESMKQQLDKLAAEDGGHIETSSIHKNNQDLEGWTLHYPGSSLAPIVYPERLYEQHQAQSDMPVSELAKAIYRSISSSIPEISDPTTELTRSNAASAVRLCVCDLKNNSGWLKDKQIPYLELADGAIAAYPRWHLTGRTGSRHGSFAVSQNLIGSLHMTKGEMLKLAADNIRNSQLRMTRLMDKLGASDPAGDSPWCIELEYPSHGAAVLADKNKLHQIYDQIGPYYIIPSSIHEILAIPVGKAEPDDLNSMIRSVNRECVALEDQLSDKAFEYDGRSLRIAGSRSEDIDHKELKELLSTVEKEARHASI